MDDLHSYLTEMYAEPEWLAAFVQNFTLRLSVANAVADPEWLATGLSDITLEAYECQTGIDPPKVQRKVTFVANGVQYLVSGPCQRELFTTLPTELVNLVLGQVTPRDIVNLCDIDALQSSIRHFSLQTYREHSKRLEEYGMHHFEYRGDFVDSFKRYLSHRKIWLYQSGRQLLTIHANLPFDVARGFALWYLFVRPPIHRELFVPPSGCIVWKRRRVLSADLSNPITWLADELLALHVRVHIQHRHPQGTLQSFLLRAEGLSVWRVGFTVESLTGWYNSTLQHGLGGTVARLADWRNGEGLPQFPLTPLFCNSIANETLKKRYKGLCKCTTLGWLMSNHWMHRLRDPLGEWAICVETLHTYMMVKRAFEAKRQLKLADASLVMSEMFIF